MPEQVTLQRVTAQFGKERLLLGRLDPFGDDAQVKRLAQGNDG